MADIAGPAGAPLVVLLHGGGQTRHSWAGAMGLLVGAGYRVISFDARGHGDSDWSPEGHYDLPSRARDLQVILAEEDRAASDRPTALVGASMGGMTSFYGVGKGLLHSIRGLVLVDIVLRPAEAGVRKIQSFMQGHTDGFATLEAAADAVAAYNPQRPRPRDISGLMKNLRRRDDGRLHWHWDTRMLEPSTNPDTPDWSDQLIAVSHGVTVPTLLIRGDQSDIVDDQGVSELKRLVPQTQVLDVAGAGHMVAGDRNDAFNAGVLAFLAEHMPAR
ncbi:alpha/beta fold hydrolase [Novosphingobium rosa]|uniref:alpha/beta fold hydrolase n=1 Tax=Novosphingobium rosa TaxID=76978 RepID=UPI001FDEBBB5|nr:alpha/beta hydrolase [Novosphingobium rosa]